MHIDVIVNPIHTYGERWSPDAEFLAGTEEAVVRWSKHFTEKGHKTLVYYDGVPGTYDGVDYLPRDQYKSQGVCLNVKSSDVRPQSKTAYLTNETDLEDREVSDYDAVVLPTQWAVDNIPFEHPNKVIISYGYDEKTIYPGPKIPKQVLYCSSPDRGLATLLQSWPDIVKYHPDATLIVTYGFKNEQKRNIPNLMALGRVNDETMVELFQSSDIWTHPCNGGELYCIAGVKAQAAGCVPVVFPTMALAETVRHGVFSSEESYVSDMVSILGNEAGKQEIRARLQEETYPTWQTTGDQLISLLGSLQK